MGEPERTVQVDAVDYCRDLTAVPARRVVATGAGARCAQPAQEVMSGGRGPRLAPRAEPAKGTVRPWYVTATGYLAVLFREHEEAERAQRGLREHGLPEQDLRLYEAEETLRLWSRMEEERSILAKAVAALVADRPARERYLSNARSGAPPCDRCPDQGTRRPVGGAARRLAVLRRGWLGRHLWGRRLTSHTPTATVRVSSPSPSTAAGGNRPTWPWPSSSASPSGRKDRQPKLECG
jgi:hypothetical protein